jgi:hypothetical protein
VTGTTDFDGFYRDTSRRLLRYAYGLSGDPGEAQDLVQEASARAWQRWRRLSGYEDPEAWLRLITMDVFDPATGRPGASVGWFNADTLLLLPIAVPGTATLVALSTGKLTQLGNVPEVSGKCTWTADRLARPTGNTVEVWRLPG